MSYCLTTFIEYKTLLNSFLFVQDSHAYMVLKDQVEKLMEEVAVKDEQIVSLNAKMREFDRDMR